MRRPRSAAERRSTIPPVIVGYSSPVSSNALTVSNTAANPGGALATTASTGLGNVTLTNVNNVLAGGGTASLSATLAVGQGVGPFTQSNVTLTYADASTYSGAIAVLGTTTLSISGNVLDHAAPALSISASNFGARDAKQSAGRANDPLQYAGRRSGRPPDHFAPRRLH